MVVVRQSLAASLWQPAASRILFVVADGLGGLPQHAHGRTELETAVSPQLDRLASEGTVGLCTPIAPGITPGSGPAHLALFGYDPLEYPVARGVLDALGVGVELKAGDVAVRGNLCTFDESGRVVDRRAGRIPSAESVQLVRLLNQRVRIEGIDVLVAPVRDHRVVIRIRAPNLGSAVSDTDPLETGKPPLDPRALDEHSRVTARVVGAIGLHARQILSGQPRANGLLLRGLGSMPHLSSMREQYGLTAAAVAGYPTYRGLGRLLGMTVIEDGTSLAEHVAAIIQQWSDYDFFFLHFKDTDSRGEDGDFDGKVRAIERLDAALAQVLALEPDVVVVTGDHSTPATLSSHSFHPVPLLLWAPSTVRPDDVRSFGERACVHGGLAQIRAIDVMPLVLAHAGRLRRYGA